MQCLSTVSLTKRYEYHFLFDACMVTLSTVCWFSATMPTAVFYSLSTVCQYLTLYLLLVLCHYDHCCLLRSVQCLSIPHTVPPVDSVSLCPLLSSTVCPLSLSTSHSTIWWFCVTMSIVVFYSLSTVFQYFTLYRLLDLCHYVHCYLLHSVHFLPVTHTVPSDGSVSPCPLLSSTVCPSSVSTTHCVHCLSVPHTVQSVHYLSVPHTVQSVHCLSVPHTVQSVHCLSVPHTVQSIHCLSVRHTLESLHCLPVPHTPYPDRGQTAGYPAALTSSALSQWQLWQTWLNVLWLFGQRKAFSVVSWPPQ
jgi:hypothetical protein